MAIQDSQHYKDIDDIMGRAMAFATDAHEGQTRSDGTPYVLHPMRVASIVREYRKNNDLDAPSSLHDVKEDCGVSREEIIEIFGEKTANIVEELTLPEGKMSRDLKTIVLADMAKSMSDDAKWIKLADRYDNLLDCRKTWRLKRFQAYARQGLTLYKALSPYPEGSEQLRLDLLLLIADILGEEK